MSHIPSGEGTCPSDHEPPPQPYLSLAHTHTILSRVFQPMSPSHRSTILSTFSTVTALLFPPLASQSHDTTAMPLHAFNSTRAAVSSSVSSFEMVVSCKRLSPCDDLSTVQHPSLDVALETGPVHGPQHVDDDVDRETRAQRCGFPPGPTRKAIPAHEPDPKLILVQDSDDVNAIRPGMSSTHRYLYLYISISLYLRSIAHVSFSASLHV
jgi:hypothetical protein